MADYSGLHDTPLIVAAVECNAGANNERLVEYSPTGSTTRSSATSTARVMATMSWYIHRFSNPSSIRNFPHLPDREHTFNRRQQYGAA